MTKEEKAKKKKFYAMRCAMICRAIRSLLDLNQVQLAEKLDMGRTTVASIESMTKVPRATVLLDLMELAYKCGITFKFETEGMQIFVNNEAHINFLDKIADEAHA